VGRGETAGVILLSKPAVFIPAITSRRSIIYVPYVNIKITREGASAEQKAVLIREVTRLLAEVLGKNPQTTVVVIEEVETDNWGIGGETVSVLRQRAGS
jgi:4-oxalocrotonate tautomerase